MTRPCRYSAASRRGEVLQGSRRAQVVRICVVFTDDARPDSVAGGGIRPDFLSPRAREPFAVRCGGARGRAFNVCTGRKGAPGRFGGGFPAASRHRSHRGNGDTGSARPGPFPASMPDRSRVAPVRSSSGAVLRRPFFLLAAERPGPARIRRPKSGFDAPRSGTLQSVRNLSTRRVSPAFGCARRGSFFHASCPQGTWFLNARKPGFRHDFPLRRVNRQNMGASAREVLPWLRTIKLFLRTPAVSTPPSS